MGSCVQNNIITIFQYVTNNNLQVTFLLIVYLTVYIIEFRNNKYELIEQIFKFKILTSISQDLDNRKFKNYIDSIIQ